MAVTREPLEGIGRLTPQRRLVVERLAGLGRALSAQELYDLLRAERPSLGRATVFRTLDHLVEVGLAQRFEGDNHVYLYSSCHGGHHHHLMCRGCGATLEIEDDAVELLLEDVQRRHGFRLDHDRLDFYGLCEACGGRA